MQELIFDNQKQHEATMFASALALTRLASVHQNSTDNKMDISKLDIFVRLQLNKYLIDVEGVIPDETSNDFERQYLEYCCYLISEASGESIDSVIGEIFSVAATHTARLQKPVEVGVVPNDFGIPEEWLND
jgi:hypothetical protein